MLASVLLFAMMTLDSGHPSVGSLSWYIARRLSQSAERKEHWQPHRPWLGMEVTNLYAAPVQITERIIRKFPDILKGVIVEKVVPGSSAESAGIKHGNVIIQFGGKRIQSLLELFESAWNKVRESVEVTVIRASNDGPLHLSMVVNEATSE